MERLRHLVVVLPGIGGSVLADPDGVARYALTRGRLARTVLNPRYLDLDAAVPLSAVDLVSSVTVFPGFTVAGYEGLVRSLIDVFGARVDVARPGAERDLGADVVLFPYDFRVSVADTAHLLAEEVQARLAVYEPEQRLRRVIVVGHSLGGLVARFWLGPLEGARYCRGLVTAGTPHRGAPKALDWLVNGVRLGPVPHPGATRVLAGWPSVYELLPRYRVAYDESTGRAVYPHQLHGIATEEFLQRAGDAYALHESIETAWQELADGDPKARPEVVPLFARGHATPARVTTTGRRLTVAKLPDPHWLPQADWRGDGTVPAISAIPIEMDEQRAAWHPVPHRHVPMAAAGAIVETVRTLNGASLRFTRGDTPDRPWLGLDVEDTLPTQTPVTVSAWLHGLRAAADTARLRLSLRAFDDTTASADTGSPARRMPPIRVPMTAVDGYWTAQADPLPQGVYEVTVEAVGVAQVERVVCQDVLAVVRP